MKAMRMGLPCLVALLMLPASQALAQQVERAKQPAPQAESPKTTSADGAAPKRRKVRVRSTVTVIDPAEDLDDVISRMRSQRSERKAHRSKAGGRQDARQGARAGARQGSRGDSDKARAVDAERGRGHARPERSQARRDRRAQRERRDQRRRRSRGGDGRNFSVHHGSPPRTGR